MRSSRGVLSIAGSLCGVSASLAAADANGKSDWSDVTALRPGQEIQLRADAGIDGHRSFLFADDAELVVLHVSHPALPRSVRRRLREISVDQPAVLLSARQ